MAIELPGAPAADTGEQPLEGRIIPPGEPLPGQEQEDADRGSTSRQRRRSDEGVSAAWRRMWDGEWASGRTRSRTKSTDTDIDTDPAAPVVPPQAAPEPPPAPLPGPAGPPPPRIDVHVHLGDQQPQVSGWARLWRGLRRHLHPAGTALAVGIAVVPVPPYWYGTAALWAHAVTSARDVLGIDWAYALAAVGAALGVAAEYGMYRATRAGARPRVLRVARIRALLITSVLGGLAVISPWDPITILTGVRA